jgi:hypothetical protein
LRSAPGSCENRTPSRRWTGWGPTRSPATHAVGSRCSATPRTRSRRTSAGAALALEDAVVLTAAVADTDDVAAALWDYDAARRPRTQP